MTYKEALSYIKADYLRYSNSVGGVLDVLLHQRGFVYIFWLRLASVNGIFLPFCWLVHHVLSTLYGVQISRSMTLGRGFYIGHGVSIVINASAVIGEHCDIYQMSTIGSWHSNAAIIGNNVVIGPNVNIVENVKIGDNVIIGAGSVVTKDIPSNCMVVGNPAKVIKKLNLTTMLWEKYID